MADCFANVSHHVIGSFDFNTDNVCFSAGDRIVSTYLVHQGFCATAESFAHSTGQSFEEELVSIKNRQRESSWGLLIPHDSPSLTGFVDL